MVDVKGDPNIDKKSLLDSDLQPAVMQCFRFGSKLRANQAKRFEQRLDDNSSDLEARVVLLGFYRRNYSKGRQNSQRYVNMLGWFIDNFPTSFLLEISEYNQYDSNFRSLQRKWLKQTRIHSKDVNVLKNAAHFCSHFNPRRSEKIWLRAVEVGDNAEWRYQLTRLYLHMARSRKSSQRMILVMKAVSQWAAALDQRGLTPQVIEETTICLAEACLDCQLSDRAKDFALTLLRRKGWIRDTSSLKHVAHLLAARALVLDGQGKKASKHLSKMVSNPNVRLHEDINPTFVNGLLELGEIDAAVMYIEFYISIYQAVLSGVAQYSCMLPGRRVLQARCKALSEWLDEARYCKRHRTPFDRFIPIRA